MIVSEVCCAIPLALSHTVCVLEMSPVAPASTVDGTWPCTAACAAAALADSGGGLQVQGRGDGSWESERTVCTWAELAGGGAAHAQRHPRGWEPLPSAGGRRGRGLEGWRAWAGPSWAVQGWGGIGRARRRLPSGGRRGRGDHVPVTCRLWFLQKSLVPATIPGGSHPPYPSLWSAARHLCSAGGLLGAL